VVGILNVHQVQTIWRSGTPKYLSVTPHERRLQVERSPLASTHTDQRTGNVSHHAQQEGVGGDIYHHERSVASNHDMINPAKRGRRLTSSCTQRREVMFTYQALARSVHGSIIQHTGRGHPATGKRVCFSFLENIQVAPSRRREPRMKIVGHPTHPVDTDRRGKMRIQAPAPCIRRAHKRCYKTDHLTRCMHPGIGSTRCTKLGSPGFYLLQCGLDRVLHSQTIGLGLETLKGIACIGDAQRQSMAQDARLSSKERARSFCA